MSRPLADAFCSRARDEAARYGSDPWIFVRELLQNARDSGASRVIFDVESTEDAERITCRDDGDGLSFDEARAYLFTLYASNKRGVDTQAGRFGLGFWSILRFEPEQIVIRSRPRGGGGWQIRLDGELRRAEWSPYAGAVGTEVVLERSQQTPGLAGHVQKVAAADGRFLTRRDEPSVALDVLINGERVNQPFALPAPAVSFARPGLRGVVGLGRESRVELFAFGLRVRTAAFLEDLVTAEEPRRNGQPPDAPEGLLPQVLLDSDRLQVLLARSDAREDRFLQRAVRLAEKELSRLVRRMLDASAPVSWPVRLRERVRRIVPARVARFVVIAAMMVALFGVGWFAVRATGWRPPTLLPSRTTVDSSGATEQSPAVRPYEDLAQLYSGPSVEVLATRPRAVDLRYRPAARTLLFAALRIEGLNDDGVVLAAAAGEPVAVHPPAACTKDCVEMELATTASASWLRLPVPTGMMIDPASVTVNGEPVVVYANAAAEPLLRGAAAGRVTYRAGPGLNRGRLPRPRWPALPPSLADLPGRYVGLQRHELVQHATASVGSLVTYDVSPATAQRYRPVAGSGPDLFTQAVTIGRGDCDVQNSLLAAVLGEAGVPARLVVGYVGVDGRAAPWLHAWVEFLDEKNRWSAADASGGASLGSPAERLDVTSAASASAQRQQGGPSKLPLLARWLAAIGIGLTAGAVVAAGLLRQGRLRRAVRMEASPDLPGLLRAALRQPEAFVHVPELYHRRVVPCLGGHRLSITRAKELAAQGRLFRCGDKDNRLANQAVARGAFVIDDTAASGEAVADLLSAADLELWQRLLQARHPLAVAARVNRLLQRGGERCAVAGVRGARDPLTLIDLEALGLSRPVSGRLVLVDVDCQLARRAHELAAEHAGQAVLLLMDAVLRMVQLPEARRARLLARAAGTALAGWRSG